MRGKQTKTDENRGKQTDLGVFLDAVCCCHSAIGACARCCGWFGRAQLKIQVLFIFDVKHHHAVGDRNRRSGHRGDADLPRCELLDIEGFFVLLGRVAIFLLLLAQLLGQRERIQLEQLCARGSDNTNERTRKLADSINSTHTTPATHKPAAASESDRFSAWKTELCKRDGV